MPSDPFMSFVSSCSSFPAFNTAKQHRAPREDSRWPAKGGSDMVKGDALVHLATKAPARKRGTGWADGIVKGGRHDAGTQRDRRRR